MNSKILYTYLILSIITAALTFKNSSEPAIDLRFPQIASKYGYGSEEHDVVTEDGYILKVFRLNQPSCDGNVRRRPILLMHGYVLSADAWIVSGRSSLGFLIADQCFDLWIGNFRGNVYSRNHIRLNPDKDLDFWNFSHTELGKYDIPALIDYILEAKGTDELIYIGFSQGGGSFYVMCSERPKYSKKVSLMIALAPATRQLNTRSLLFELAIKFADKYQNNFKEAAIGEFLSKSSIQKICYKFRIICDLVKDVFAFVASQHPHRIPNEAFKDIANTFLAGTSVQNSAHFGQLQTTTEFRKYDYGTVDNFKIYNTAKPPSYNLSAVNTPVVVMYGLNDGIVHWKDVLWSTKQIPNVLEVYEVKESLWAHLDFVYSNLVKELVFPKVNEYLLKYDKGLK